MTTGTVRSFQLFVGGQDAAAESGRTLPTVNPATGEEWAAYADAQESDVAAAVAAARAASTEGPWSSMSASGRGRLMMRLADAVAANVDELALLETTDNGRLLRDATAQLRSVPEWLFYFGGLADKIEGAVVPLPRPDAFAYTRKEPLGVVGVITPWNSPLWLTIVSAAPAIAAGNTIVVKPSEFAGASVLLLARLADEVGFPPGVINVVTGGAAAGTALVDDPRVAKLAFTGSTATGAAIAARVAGRLARYTVELGGKSPNIVFADADLDAAEEGAVSGIFGNAGQACVAGSRLLVDAQIYDDFVVRVIRRADELRVGDPLEETSDVGPIATAPQLGRVESMVDAARAAGAEVAAGGCRAQVDSRPEGFYYRPTVLVRVDNDHSIAQDEVFGPVLVALPFRDEDEAVALANDSRYGLAAGVWTRSLDRAHRVSGRLQAGMVWLNTYKAIAYSTPFGGYKDSGIGRLNGRAAVEEFLQTKTVWHEPGSA
jgi:aldehyde dehydrogenase (NAD+)